jgi:hypothetical protein
MSQPSPAKAEDEDTKKDVTQPVPKADADESNASENEKVAKTRKEKKPNENTVDESRALHVASSVIIDKRLGSPSSLYWHIQKKKKKKEVIFPVRIPSDESEYIGHKEVLDMKIKDATKQVVVQYVQFPHVEYKSKKDVGLYDAISRSQLAPYHNNGVNSNAWCPKLSKQYFKQLKANNKGKIGEQQIRIEELFLERILKRAMEEEAEQQQQQSKLDQYGEAVKEPGETNVEEISPTQEDDLEEEPDDDGNRRSKRKRGYGENDNTEWLHVGDVIEFYKPGTGAGIKENLLQATITAINPREDPALTVDCEGELYIHIQNDHHIRRIKRKERSRLVDCNGKYNAVESFTMKKEGNKQDSVKEGIRKRVASVKEITEKHKGIAMENIAKDGCGPTDMFR